MLLPLGLPQLATAKSRPWSRAVFDAHLQSADPNMLRRVATRQFSNLRARDKINQSFRRPIHPDWLRCSSVAYRRVCSLLTPCQSGASTFSPDRFILSRTLTWDTRTMTMPKEGVARNYTFLVTAFSPGRGRVYLGDREAVSGRPLLFASVISDLPALHFDTRAQKWSVGTPKMRTHSC